MSDLYVFLRSSAKYVQFVFKSEKVVICAKFGFWKIRYWNWSALNADFANFSVLSNEKRNLFTCHFQRWPAYKSFSLIPNEYTVDEIARSNFDDFEVYL